MRRALLLCLVLALTGCGGADTPEQQVREIIGRMEKAAEARDVGDLMEHISNSYRDAYGQGTDEASRYVRGYFIANQSIHLLTRVENVEFPNSEEARATVLVGMVSRDADAKAAWDLAANLYRFEITLLKESGAWKVSYARWQKT
jgi:hypothetical protein